MNKRIKIGSNFISLNDPTYFIADIAANWDGEIERAKDLIYLSAEMGADAAKFQNFKRILDFCFLLGSLLYCAAQICDVRLSCA
mgnify:CR=1 FL=1